MTDINFERLQATMSEQNRRFTYTRNQFDSPYLQKRAQEMENFRLKQTKKANKAAAKQGPETHENTVAGFVAKPGQTVKGAGPKAKPGEITSAPLRPGSPDLSPFDHPHVEKTASPIWVHDTPKKSAPVYKGGHKGSSQSPTNFRDQGTAGLTHFGESVPFGRFGRALQGTVNKIERTRERMASGERSRGSQPGGESLTARAGHSLMAKADAIGQRRAATSGSSSESLSAARGVTHSTGESWASRTGKSLLAKADQIGTQRAVQSRSFPSTGSSPSGSSEGWAARTGKKLVNKAGEIGQRRNGQGGRSF